MPKWLSKLERRLRPYAIPNLTALFVFGQVIAYVLGTAEPEFVDRLMLKADHVLAGQWWRLATFLFVPPSTNLIFAFFGWYLFYLMGTALEANWGALRYNVYLLIAILATIAVAFAVPDQPMSNAFIGGSVFLAFAYLYPDFQMMLFFILPVKIKYLALVTWIIFFLTMVTADDWATRGQVAAGVLNFFIFFGKDVVRQLHSGKRRMEFQHRRLTQKQPEFRHKCTVCGITDKTHPEMEFRYCSKCKGTHGYCSEHLRNHEHIQAPAVETATKPRV